VKRRPLGLSSPAGSSRLATASRTARAFEVHVIDEPTAAPGADDVDRQHLIAIRPLQLHPIGAQVVAARYEQRSLDDAVAGMVEIFLNDGEALVQDVGVHRPGGGAALGAPQFAHAFLIVGLHGREKLRDRLIHGLRNRRPRPGTAATGSGTGEQKQKQREPSLHDGLPEVGTTRR